MIVPRDYLIGKTLAKNIIDTSTGEFIAQANDEVTEELLDAMANNGILQI